MYEKVNPMHPDKIADRIAGAMLDIAYSVTENPKCAIEVLIGHGNCHIISESNVLFKKSDVEELVERIAKQKLIVDLKEYGQDAHLRENQAEEIKCGDNGIFRGMPVTQEQKELALIADWIYREYNCDGKYIIDYDNLIVCQSNAEKNLLQKQINSYTIFELFKKYKTKINPIGDWTGGLDVDTGATNRKLGSDMGDAVTGGGLHGKDLSKADVSVNIYAYLKAQKTKRPVELWCSIGDTEVDGVPFEVIVEMARKFIDTIGGFEKFAEWGLIRG